MVSMGVCFGVYFGVYVWGVFQKMSVYIQKKEKKRKKKRGIYKKMPTGMNSKKNMRPRKKGERPTLEECAAGGKKAGEVRRERRTIRECIQIYAAGNMTPGELEEMATEFGITGIKNRGLLLAAPIIKKALSGDLRASEIVLKYLGEDLKDTAFIAKLQAETQLLTAQADALRRQQEEAAELGAVTVNVNITNTAGEND